MGKNLILIFILVINTGLVIKKEIIIPIGGTVTTIDGKLGEEWNDARIIPYILKAGSNVKIFLKHDKESLYVAFSGLTDEPLRVPEVLIDAGLNKTTTWDENDWWFHTSARDCWSKGRYNDYSSCTNEAGSWEANNASGSRFPDIYEIKIPFKTIGIDYSPGMKLGVGLCMTDTNKVWELWPKGASLENPSSWNEVIIE